MLHFNPNITAIEEEGAFAVLDRALALKAQGKPIINLGIGQPDFSPPGHVLEAAAKAVRDGPHGYTSPIGIPPLREARSPSSQRALPGIPMSRCCPMKSIAIWFSPAASLRASSLSPNCATAPSCSTAGRRPSP